MSDVIAFLVAHGADLLTILGLLVAVATAVTRLTPSPKDDEVVRKIAAFLSFLQPKDVGGVKAPLTPPKKGPLFGDLQKRDK